MNYNIYSPQSYLNQQQPIFPQPNGNVYLINSSLEVANIPAGAGVTAALCYSENLLYLKTVQGGVPTFLAYKLAPYTESPKAANNNNNSPTLEDRIVALEQQLQKLINALSGNGGKRNDESATPAAAASEWN